MPTSEAPGLADLPAQVRDRVVALTAEVLPAVPSLPGPLTRVASFTPARRARLGGTAIVAALDDEDFRAAVGVQLAAVRESRAEDPGLTRPSPEAAAVEWLVRAEGWRARLASDLDAQASARDDHELAATRAELERLRGQVAGLQASLRDQRAEHRAELEQVRSDNLRLRQRLGDARREARSASDAREVAETAAAAAVARAEKQVAQAEAEVRRASAEAEEARAGGLAGRREGRAEREGASIRARYLLDTVIDAAAGLRRELALPAATAAPGAAVEREIGEAASSMGPADRRTTSPAALDHLLAMPRARLLVDGYNVTKQTWPSLTLEAQRSRLVTGLGPLVARTGAETTVVFDAAGTGAARSPAPAPRGVKVAFSPEGVIADDVLRRLVAEEPVGRVVVVVTSDAALARDLAAAGARVVPSASLAQQLTR